MRDNYDFSDAVKNPFARRFNGKYTVKVHYDFSKKSEEQEDEKLEKNSLISDESGIK